MVVKISIPLQKVILLSSGVKVLFFENGLNRNIRKIQTYNLTKWFNVDRYSGAVCESPKAPTITSVKVLNVNILKIDSCVE